MNLTWIIARAAPGAELRVRTALRERRFSAYVPCERRWRSARGKAAEAVDCPMYPGYVFVGTTEQKRHELEKVPGLLGTVHTSFPSERLAELIYDMTIRQLAGEYDRTGQSKVSSKPAVGPMDTSLGHGMEALLAILTEDARGRPALAFPGQDDVAA